MRSFRSVLTVLLAASIGVFAPLEARATSSPGEDWADVADTESQPCVPQFSVDFQLPARVIVVDQQDSCPVSTQVYVKLADDRRNLRLIAHQSKNLSGRWVTQVDPVAKGGVYRVMGVEYLNGQMAPPLDQRITITGTQQEKSAPTPSQVELPSNLRQQEPRLSTYMRQEPRSEPAQAQVLTLDPESTLLLRKFDQWMRWLRIQMYWLKANLLQLEPLIRAIESIQDS